MHKCKPCEFLCQGSGVCIDAERKCDGKSDCDNNEDENNCPTNVTIAESFKKNARNSKKCLQSINAGFINAKMAAVYVQLGIFYILFYQNSLTL